jgi:hypothetical protein
VAAAVAIHHSCPLKVILDRLDYWAPTLEGLAVTVWTCSGASFCFTLDFWQAKDVPVRAFWSVIVYDANGFIPEKDLGIYSYNNVTAKPNADGSITIHFGGDPDQINYLPIAEGWNYAIRMYEPGKEILDGSWTFPKIVPAK